MRDLASSTWIEKCTRGNTMSVLNPQASIRISNKLFRVLRINLWNSLSENVIFAPPLHAFKKTVEKEQLAKPWNNDWVIPESSIWERNNLISQVL